MQTHWITPAPPPIIKLKLRLFPAPVSCGAEPDPEVVGEAVGDPLLILLLVRSVWVGSTVRGLPSPSSSSPSEVVVVVEVGVGVPMRGVRVGVLRAV